MKVRDVRIDNRIGESAKVHIYLGTAEEDSRVIVKVSKTFEDGNILAKEAIRFGLMHTFYQKAVVPALEAPGVKNPHFDWLFARLLSSFMDPFQEDRRVNILTVPDTSVAKLTPLAKLRDKTEIDTRTSVWILGRLFKFYGFFEIMAIADNSSAARYPLFSPGDYLLGPERHRLIYYNYSGDMTAVIANDFVKKVTGYIKDWTVGDDNDADKRYLELIKDLSENGRESFEHAHGELYRLANELWGIKYHPFTYRDCETYTWKTIKEEN